MSAPPATPAPSLHPRHHHVGDLLIAAAETIHTRDPDACRAHAERYFSHLVMAEEYVRMYRALLDTGKLPPGRPTP